MAVPGRIIIEFINVGSALKVCAICERTGREVSIVGDPKASREQLKRVASNKLRFVMAKEAENLRGRRGITA